MNTNTAKKTALAAFGLVATCALSMAATYTWDGGASPDNNWGAAANWNPDGAPSGSGHTLLFGGSGQVANNNILTSVGTTTDNGIEFLAGAGAFTLTGNNLTFAGNIVNNSTSEQTFNLNLAISGNNRSINTRYGDITINGILSGGATNQSMDKYGLGTLKLTGINTGLSWITVRAGTLELDASTGDINSFRYVILSSENTTAFAVTEDDYVFEKTVTRAGHAASTIKADGIDLTLLSSAKTAGMRTTMNFDVSAVGSSISFVENPVQSAGRILSATVTDTTGKTGFATTVLDDKGTPEEGDDVYTVTRLAGLADLSTDPVTDATTNAFIDTSYTNTADRTLNSLTIQGAGTFDGAGVLSVDEILMEEGTGNYTFNTGIHSLDRGGGGTLYIHQYSTDGILTFNSHVLHTFAIGASLVKTGPGTVIFGAGSTNFSTGATHIQGGELVVDGAFTRTASVSVYAGATLSGEGAFGATDPSTVNVFAGGTLAGTSSRALAITGTLTLQADSNFDFTLDSGADFVNVTGTVTLLENVNLTLALNDTPAIDQVYFLIKSTDSITGNLVYNNTVMTNDTAFSLGGYDFTYFQDSKDIWVQAIPEPSAALLFALGAVFLLFRHRKP